MLSWHSVALPSVAPIVNPSRAASLLQGVLNALGQEKQLSARLSAHLRLARASEQRLALFVLHSGIRSVGMAMHNQLSNKPALSRCLGEQKKSSIPPVLMEIVKEPDDGYTSGSLREEQQAYEYNTSCRVSTPCGAWRCLQELWRESYAFAEDAQQEGAGRTEGAF